MKYKNKKPLVSVIIPCYNGEKFIGEAIESVLNQTYKNWELIIVDDGSTDGSKAVIKPFLKDPRIKLVEHEQNRGIPAARNTGIKVSSGKYIALLDVDDRWDPNKLELQIGLFLEKGKDVGLVFSNIKVINSKGEVIKKKRKGIKLHTSKMKNLEHLFFNNFIPSVTAVFQRNCIEKVGLFDEKILWGGDDHDFWLRIASKFNFAYLNKVLAIRREHSANFSQTERMIKGEMKLVDKVVKKYPFLKKFELQKRALLTYNLGRYKHLTGSFNEARSLYLKAISYCPTCSLKFYLAYFLTLLKIKFDRGYKKER